eukprot:2535680-Prorocentrum_lima.AAC.1
MSRNSLASDAQISVASLRYMLVFCSFKPAAHMWQYVHTKRACLAACAQAGSSNTVSYTHLTLPTICSV